MSYTKWRFVRCCNNTTFTLLFRVKTYCMKTIYILFNPEVEYAQLMLKLDIALFVHVIWMSYRWPPCIFPDGFAKPRPVIWTSYRVDVHVGGKGSRTRQLSIKVMVQPDTTFLYVHRFCIRHSHYSFSSHKAIRVLYKMSFHTKYECLVSLSRMGFYVKVWPCMALFWKCQKHPPYNPALKHDALDISLATCLVKFCLGACIIQRGTRKKSGMCLSEHSQGK